MTKVKNPYKSNSLFKNRTFVKMFSNAVFLTILGLVALTSAFNENILISDLSGCREIRLNGLNNDDFSVAISSLSNNKVNPNEDLRMKFFAIGFEFWINFKSTEKEYITSFSAWNRTACGLYSRVNPNPSNLLQKVDCQNLTHSFYYTEFTVVLTKGEFFF